MTLRPRHLPLLHHVHRTLIYGAVGLVSQPVLVALEEEKREEAGEEEEEQQVKKITHGEEGRDRI